MDARLCCLLVAAFSFISISRRSLLSVSTEKRLRVSLVFFFRGDEGSLSIGVRPGPDQEKKCDHIQCDRIAHTESQKPVCKTDRSVPYSLWQVKIVRKEQCALLVGTDMKDS